MFLDCRLGKWGLLQGDPHHRRRVLRWSHWHCWHKCNGQLHLGRLSWLPDQTKLMWVTLTDDKFFHIYRNTWKLLTCLSTHFEQDGRIIACTKPLIHFLSISHIQWSWYHHHSQIKDRCWRGFHNDDFCSDPSTLKPPTRLCTFLNVHLIFVLRSWRA